MTEKKSDALATTTKAAGAAGGAALGAIVGTVVAGPPGAAVGALAGQTLDGIMQWVVERRRGRQVRWFERLLRSHAGERLQDAVRANRPDDRVVAALVESLTAVDQAIAECAVPALADLLAQHQGPPPQPDWYFRGMNRVLRDVSDEEFDALRHLIGTVSDAIRGTDVADAQVQIWSDGHFSYPVRTRISDGFPHAERLFHLLSTNGLGVDTPNRWGEAGPRVVMRRETFERIADLLIPAA